MAESYIGEIRIFAGTFAPNGWLYCDGTLQPISEYETLFNLIGTTYGGDGQTTFALPDLRGRVPVHMGTGPGLSNYPLGASGGLENVTLSTNQIAAHAHPMMGTSTGVTASPANAMFAVASDTDVALYSTASPGTSLNAASVQPTGGSLPHTNIQPSIGLNFIISMFGIYPSPS